MNTKKYLGKKDTRLIEFFNSLTFTDIFIAWFVVSLIFAVIFFLLSYSANNALFNSIFKEGIGHSLKGFGEAVYYSIVTSTSTGASDFTPLGWGRLFAAIEIILGFLLLGMIISKFVSYKQEAILEEIYRLSFDEKITNLRSSLYLFRVNVNKLLTEVREKKMQPYFGRELLNIIESLSMNIKNVKHVLEIKEKRGSFVRTMDTFHAELILTGIERSINKLNKLFDELDKARKEWRDEKFVKRLKTIDENLTEVYRLFKLYFEGEHLMQLEQLNKVKEEFEKRIKHV